MNKFIKGLLIGCLCFVMVGCNTTSKQEETTAFTIVDQAGREVSFDKTAEKIVSGYYITTTSLIGLGQKDKLVGVEMKADTRAIYKEAAPEVMDLPAMGNKKSFNVEACASTQADVVFLPIALESYVEQLEALQMRVVLLNPETQTSYKEALQIMAKVCGAEDKLKEYEEYANTLEKTYTQKQQDASKTVYFAGSDMLSASGNMMYQGNIIKQAGGVNVIDDDTSTSWINIDKETLLKANPNYIFIEKGSVSSNVFYEDESLMELEVIKNKQVYEFPSTLETWDTPGLASCLGVLWMKSILYPNVVTSEEVKQEAKIFYKTFYNIDIDTEAFGI